MEEQRIQTALEALQRGEFVIVTDDGDRENEGDLIIAAEHVTPAKMAFLVRHTSGIVCVPMLESRLQQLRLPQMVTENTEPWRTAFTVSVDYMPNTTTGISAEDRCATIKALLDPHAEPEAFCRPGHIFPLRYREGGVLKRAGHTEAAVDLMMLADLYPAGVISELVNDDGSVSKGGQITDFAAQHGLHTISVADIVRHRRRKEKLIRKVSSARLPTPWGEFTASVYQSKLDSIEHLVLTMGDVSGDTPTLVRVHSECLTGDLFGSQRCDCGSQLHKAMALIGQEGRGALVYLRGHEGRGIGLAHKMRAYTLQDAGRDTVEANEELGLPVDSREYGIGAQILADLGIRKIRLMTNNPLKYGGLQGYDLEITERVGLSTEPTDENRAYLETKKAKLGHLLEIAKQKETQHA